MNSDEKEKNLIENGETQEDKNFKKSNPNNLKGTYSNPSESMLEELDKTRNLPFFQRLFRRLGPGSLRTAIISLQKMTTGIGVFAFPFYLYEFGLIPGTIFILLAAFLTYKSFIFYFEARDKCEKEDLTGVVSHFVPTWMSKIFRVSICLDMLACLAALSVFGWSICNFLLYYLGLYYEEWIIDPYKMKFRDYNLSLFLTRALFLHVLFVLMIPLLLKKSVEQLKWVSTISIILLFLLISLLFIQAPFFYRKYHSSDSNQKSTEIRLYKNFMKLSKLKYGFSIILGFYGQTQAYPIRNQIVQPTMKRLRKIVRFSLVYSVLLVIPLAIVGYVVWGDLFTPELIILRKQITTIPVLEIIYRILLVLFVLANFISISCFNASVRDVFLNLILSKGCHNFQIKRGKYVKNIQIKN